MGNSQDQPAPGKTPLEISAIARSTTALLAAVNASDVDGVMALWADDGVLMAPHHPSVHGRAEIERYFIELFRELRFQFSFTSSVIHVSGDSAFERVEYEASAWPVRGGPESRDVGKGVHVYRRESSGSWRLVADIWNSDAPAVAGDDHSSKRGG